MSSKPKYQTKVLLRWEAEQRLKAKIANDGVSPGRVKRTKKERWDSFYAHQASLLGVANIPSKVSRPKSPINPFYNSAEWRRVRYDALKASNGCCQLCGTGPSPGKPLNVDHVRPIKTHPELALVLDNLQVLCAPCNHGKGNRDDTDWRSPRGTMRAEAGD